ncbi:hypothetical protein C0033_13140 [Clostridium sp. chh4-2]|uniref:response regulator transcription factor n=1 Tax=Clostridium sp. chh4-2 TaxID=2067550 RepID=UPI000CCF383C|nr:response regulator [Clostridium sp. chh4-2]PNV61522.1 hypothetical protein C0033_13140 [Clostridium sp. chh4-2]
MFRVLVVDDEPSALDYICNIIKMKCPSLIIAGTAENGKDGLMKYRQLSPDLVISDVKMPIMSGLDMVKAIKEEQEDAQIVLVSGYQEFEYVRAALKYGVSDYVLKPMTPANFVSAVAPVLKVLDQRVYEQRKRLVRAMVTGELSDQEKIREYFPEERYYLAVIRENGLPRRFTGTYEIELISEMENTIFVYGRDEREALYICPSKVVGGAEFYRMMAKEAERKNGDGCFVTSVMVPHTVESADLESMICCLYKSLNSRLSIGVSQTFMVSADKGPDEMPAKEVYSQEAMKSMERCLEKKDYAMFLETLWDFIKNAGEAEYPQLRLERFVRQMSVKVQQYLNYQGDVFEDEMMLEDAFYDAGSVKELYDSLKSIFIRYWREDKEAVKLDSPEFLETIEDYIRKHLSEDITVSSVCREFGLSQSYLNLIFRKHGKQAFHSYLRNVRIERAKEIMERNPQMFIKDVAMMTGYKDQFYFSRIFRAVTGISPSEYIDSLS